MEVLGKYAVGYSKYLSFEFSASYYGLVVEEIERLYILSIGGVDANKKALRTITSMLDSKRVFQSHCRCETCTALTWKATLRKWLFATKQ
jgi:hypothetical protein